MDAIFVQQTRLGDWVAQVGYTTDNYPPDPDKVPMSKRFPTIEEAILANIEFSKETKGGFRFPNLEGYGYGPTRRENEGNTLFTLEDLKDERSFVARHAVS